MLPKEGVGVVLTVPFITLWPVDTSVEEEVPIMDDD